MGLLFYWSVPHMQLKMKRWRCTRCGIAIFRYLTPERMRCGVGGSDLDTCDWVETGELLPPKEDVNGDV